MAVELNLRQLKINLIQFLREHKHLKVPEIKALFKGGNVIISDRLIRDLRSEINREFEHWRVTIAFKTDGPVEGRGYFLASSVEEVDKYDRALAAIESDIRQQRQDLKAAKYWLYKNTKPMYQPPLSDDMGIEEKKVL